MATKSKTTVVQISPAKKSVFVYNGKPVIIYKFRLEPAKTLTFVKNYVKVYLMKKVKDSAKKEYALNIKFSERIAQDWCLSKDWMTKDELNTIPEQFQYLKDSNVDELSNIKITYFEVLVRDLVQPISTTVKIIKDVGASSDNNDCLFEAILQAFNYNTDHLPRNVKTPEGFKRKLNLARKEKVPIDMYPDVEALFNIRIHQNGDYVYESNNKTAKHDIFLHCKGNHVELRNPPVDKKRPFINFEESKKILTIHYGNAITVFDGVSETVVSDEKYNEIKSDFSNIIVKVDNSENIQVKHKEYIDKAEALNKLTGGLINKFKSSYESKLAYDMFRKFSKFLVEPEDLSELEQFAVDNSFHGGLRYSKPGEYKGTIYDYDINKMYSHHLSSAHFIFPVCEPEYIKLTKDEFVSHSNKSFKYGLYKVVVKSNHKLFNYRIGKTLWFSHHDMKIAKMLGAKLEIVEHCINFLNYDPKKCLSGYQTFKDYFDKCQEWIEKAESFGVEKKDIKITMNSLWGGMCGKKKIVKRVCNKEVGTIDLNIYHLNEHIPLKDYTVVELVEKSNNFKYNWARLGTFITSFCRLKMVETILACGLDNIVYINTDGFASVVEQPTLKVSEKMGDWSCDKYDGCVVYNSNCVKFGEKL